MSTTTTVNKHRSNCAKCAICPCRCCRKKSTVRSTLNKLSLPPTRLVDTEQQACCSLILVRHGLSQDEVDKRYSGWNDCDLSDRGNEQMHRTGQALREAMIPIDRCFTSVLKRASKSLFIIQEQMNCLWLPVENTWRLNDRMLGSLTGFRCDRAEALFGQHQIKQWLTQSHLAPPALDEVNAFHPRSHYKYQHIASVVPSTETLVDVQKRLLPFFFDQLLTRLYAGQNLLVVAHNPIIKTIIRLLNNYSVDQFENQEIPVGIPIVYQFASQTRQLFRGYYLSSAVLQNSTNDSHTNFPTGFDDGQFTVIEDLILQGTSPNDDIQETISTSLEQNFDRVDTPASEFESEFLDMEAVTMNDHTDLRYVLDTNTSDPLDDQQEEEHDKEPGFAIPSTDGIALYELATPN